MPMHVAVTHLLVGGLTEATNIHVVSDHGSNEQPQQEHYDANGKGAVTNSNATTTSRNCNKTVGRPRELRQQIHTARRRHDSTRWGSGRIS
jgi:hypothetical protein